MDSYMASNGSCFMVAWIIFKNHLLEVSLGRTFTMPRHHYIAYERHLYPNNVPKHVKLFQNAMMINKGSFLKFSQEPCANQPTTIK